MKYALIRTNIFFLVCIFWSFSTESNNDSAPIIFSENTIRDTPTPKSLAIDNASTNIITHDTIMTISSLQEAMQSENFMHSITTTSALSNNTTSTDSMTKNQRQPAIKDWTIITYMAADNDLAPFARRNLKQQADVGSNDRVNIVTQLDTRINGNIKVTKRYYIEPNKLIVMNQHDPISQKMDSGAPETLIDCCRWAIQNFPAHNYALILWNHGTGVIDIGKLRSINPLQLFSFNPSTNLIELDRNIPFLEFIQSIPERGICFDDSTGHYLTNQDLDMALKEICTNFLHGKKFSCICFDACLMAMLEIANVIKNYSDFMIASQEIELGAGYDYKRMLTPLLTEPMNKATFAKHIVASYENVYSQITNDFTQSAINLLHIPALEQNINTVATLLIDSLKYQQGTTIKDAIKASRHKLLCTHFDEPSYLDLHHFYSNVLQNLKNFQYQHETHRYLKDVLAKTLQEGMSLIKRTVIANATGKNLKLAHGISIYFPERGIHNSYHNTSFALSNQWIKFLITYLQ